MPTEQSLKRAGSGMTGSTDRRGSFLAMSELPWKKKFLPVMCKLPCDHGASRLTEGCRFPVKKSLQGMSRFPWKRRFQFLCRFQLAKRNSNMSNGWRMIGLRRKENHLLTAWLWARKTN
jgi:hypothetical protein